MVAVLEVQPNNSMQRTALRAAADAGRYKARGGGQADRKRL
jgi:hypothetical protein